LAGLGFYYALRRWPIAPRWANPIAAALVGIGLVNVLCHLYLTADPLQTTSLMLIVIACGMLPLSTRWFALLLGLTLGGWLLMIVRLPPSPLWLHFGFGMVSAVALSIIGHLVSIRTFMERERLRAQTDSLLLNILPRPIAERLKRGEHVIADDFTEVTVLFADIVNFTPLSAEMSPKEVVLLLNAVFSELDQLADKYGLEKIKTIGDAYMVVGGLPVPRTEHAEVIADMALDIQQTLAHFSRKNGEPLSMRIGIHTGPVVAGIIGVKKFSYDLWSDTVNTASRMESHGIPGKIQITQATYNLLKDDFICEPRGPLEVKGMGEVETWFLVGVRDGSVTTPNNPVLDENKT
jgi:class 3 adenylate cyclase